MSYWYYTPAAIIALVLIRKYQEFKWKSCKNKVCLKGQIVVVTGANSGIGYEVAKELARRGAKVILGCRDLEKAMDTMVNIKKSVGSHAQVVRGHAGKYYSMLQTFWFLLNHPQYWKIPMHLDLSSLQSVKSFADELQKTNTKVDILVNNAGVSYPKSEYRTTEDGLEIHFGINHVGHFLLTELLLPQLKNAAPSRVVIVSSSLHQKGNIYLNDLNEINRVGKTPSYNNSKLANAYFGLELSKRVKEFDINTYTVCPGWVYTGLFRYYDVKWYHYLFVAPIAFLFMRTPQQGAQTVIYCATEPKLDNESGLFYRNCASFKSSVEFDEKTSTQLWEATEKIIHSKLKIL